MGVPKFPPNPKVNQIWEDITTTWPNGKLCMHKTTWQWNGKGWRIIPKKPESKARARQTFQPQSRR